MNPQILALLADLAWGVGGYFEKRGLNLGGLSPQMAVTLRTGMALVIITAASLPNLKTLPHAGTKSLLMVILGGGIISGSIGMLCYYAAINGAPLSKVMPIAFTSPLFGALMGIIFGAEPLTWKVALGSLLTISGIVVLTI
jgi:transporter family protein